MVMMLCFKMQILVSMSVQANALRHTHHTHHTQHAQHTQRT